VVRGENVTNGDIDGYLSVVSANVSNVVVSSSRFLGNAGILGSALGMIDGNLTIANSTSVSFVVVVLQMVQIDDHFI
jgi:hypothetical protein